ncbi:MAG TPA: MsnO8 family LLM class oxidoreductase [Thermoanaerobaculia bacterium]
MSEPFRLGALDFCHVPRGQEPADGLWQTLDLAPALESLGYTRYWLAEHHTFDVAHSCPEMLLPILAGMTSRIHLGTAGILLRYYSPYKVASTFRLLNMIYPGRIDLGLGRGRADDLVEELLLERRQDQRPYDEKVRELLSFLRGNGEAVVNPRGIAPPEVWILGSNTTSMPLAAENGTAFCLALFFDQDVDPQGVLADYQDRFQPSPELPAPRWSIAVAGVCHEDEEEARRIAGTRQQGVSPVLVGTPEQCRDQIESLRERYRTSEIVFLDLSQEYEDRVNSYRLLAEALDVRSEDAPVRLAVAG